MPETKLTQYPELLGSSQKDQSVLEHASRSFFYSLAQAPLNGAVQLVDKTTGSNMLASIQFIEPPPQAEFASRNWHAQQFGNAAGMLPWFIAMHKGGSALLSRATGVELKASHAFLSKQTNIEIGAAGLSGLVYGGLLTPTKPNEDFLLSRLRNAGSSALTFSTLAASFQGLEALGLRSKIASGALSGLPAGFVAAESHSLLSGKGFASGSELLQSVYGFSIVGAGFGAIQPARSPSEAARPTIEAARPTSEIARSPSEVLRNGDLLNVKNPKTGETLQARVEIKPAEKGGTEIHLKDLNGEPLAFARYKVLEPTPGQQSPQFLYGNPRVPQSFLWLDMMRVELPGKGIKETLVEHLRAESERLGFEGRIKLQAANDFGTVAAIPWYKAGFRPQEGAIYFGPKFKTAAELLRSTVEGNTRLTLEEGSGLNNLLMYLPEAKK